jgi:hypothetical protein
MDRDVVQDAGRVIDGDGCRVHNVFRSKWESCGCNTDIDCETNEEDGFQVVKPFV